MAKVTYLEGRTSQYGYEFTAGESTEVTNPKHLAKFAGNPSFLVEGAANDEPDAEQPEPPAPAQTGQRDENGDTPEMATMRGQFDRAFEAVKGELVTANATIETLTAEIAQLRKPVINLKAEHHGGGKFNITNGETVLAKGLSKADADAFNAMTPAEQAEYVKTNS